MSKKLTLKEFKEKDQEQKKIIQKALNLRNSFQRRAFEYYNIDIAPQKTRIRRASLDSHELTISLNYENYNKLVEKAKKKGERTSLKNFASQLFASFL